MCFICVNYTWVHPQYLPIESNNVDNSLFSKTSNLLECNISFHTRHLQQWYAYFTDTVRDIGIFWHLWAILSEIPKQTPRVDTHNCRVFFCYSFALFNPVWYKDETRHGHVQQVKRRVSLYGISFNCVCRNVVFVAVTLEQWFQKWAVPPPGGRWDYRGGR
jgi:hypothetical protein